MIKPEDVYKIGSIGKPHGVRGEVSFQFEDDVFDRVDAGYLLLEREGILVPFFIEGYRFRGSSVALVKFEDIDTQDAARELTGCSVFFPRELAGGEAESLSWAAIRGFTLIDEATGNAVGTIVGVDDSTQNLLFEVQTGEGTDLLIPASEQLIKDVDTANRQITVALPEGLLDL